MTTPLFGATLALTFTMSCAAASFIRGTPKTAEQQYKVSMDDLHSGLYPEALSGFSALKTKYPYSKYAALADLRRADTFFKQGKYTEAIDAYRNFLKYHPHHAQAPYAMLQIGEAYYQQIPTDWWFLPPAAEKDQADTRLAISAYRDMIARYPQAKVTAKARKRLETCRRKLADHELYVARFYFKRDDYKAAARRAEGLLDVYGGLGLDRVALWIDARARLHLGDTETATGALRRLTKEFPDTSEGEKAKKMLASMPASPAGKTGTSAMGQQAQPAG